MTASAEVDVPRETSPDVPRETPPSPGLAETVPRRPGWRDKVKGLGRRKAAAAVPTRERAPKAPRRTTGRRVPLDTDISDAWGFIGRRLEGGPHYPTGRMLTYQAPAAGVILDKALAGSLPDRLILQPMARGRDKYEDAAFLLAGPLLTFALTRSYQELAVAMERGDTEAIALIQRRLAVQQESFEWMLEMMLPKLAAGKKVAEEKKAARDKIVNDAFPELQGTGTSPSQALIAMIFAPPVPPTQEGVSQNGKAGHAHQDAGGPGAVDFGNGSPVGARPPA